MRKIDGPEICGHAQIHDNVLCEPSQYTKGIDTD